MVTDVETIATHNGRVLKKNDPKHQIYKGIIQYLLDTTPYTIKNIAELSNSSVKIIRSIYCDNQIPSRVSTELSLVKLYHMIIELHLREPDRLRG